MFKMKSTTFHSQQTLLASHVLKIILLLLLLPIKVPGEESTEEKRPAETDITISTFTVPRTLNEGRDPFYPSSTRVIATARPVTKVARGPATLELKGISGTSNRPLALINNRTFAEGDEQDVTTPQGKVKVLCLEIEGTRVRIQAEGQTRELMLRQGI